MHLLSNKHFTYSNGPLTDLRESEMPTDVKICIVLDASNTKLPKTNKIAPKEDRLASIYTYAHASTHVHTHTKGPLRLCFPHLSDIISLTPVSP